MPPCSWPSVRAAAAWQTADPNCLRIALLSLHRTALNSRRRLATAALLPLLCLAGVLSPGTAEGAGFNVAAENAQAGTPNWQFAKSKFDERTLAFADRVSVLPGQHFGLYVSCRAKQVTVQALRIGYYSGAGARRIWSSPSTPCQWQRNAVIDTATGMARAPWTRTLDITTTGWPEGMYVLKLLANDGSATYVDMVLRSPSSAGRVVFVSSTQTFQAYNQWGGANLYRGRKGFVSRARVVTYDRPQTWGYGSGKFLEYEAPLLMQAERLGLPLAYITDTDIAAQPRILDGALSIISGGHSEYWTQTQRDAVMAARTAGSNLLFFGANTSYWRGRLSRSPLGADRVLTVYKVASEDPLRAHPSVRFRDLGQPDAQLLGATYNCFPARGAFTVSKASSFVFAGTGVHNGQAFAGIIGPEVDQLRQRAANVELLASSPTRCGRHRTHASMVLMHDPSGAATVDVGTMGWVSKALRGEAPPASVRLVAIVTDNLLRASTRRGLA